MSLEEGDRGLLRNSIFVMLHTNQFYQNVFSAKLI